MPNDLTRMTSGLLDFWLLSRRDGSTHKATMAIRYEIRRKLDNGEVLCVAESDDREKADELAQSLKQLWPGEYEVLEVISDDYSARP